MEELRSTEILDKEIQLEARKKADKILKKAENDCLLIKSEVSARVESAKKEKEQFYNQNISAFEKNLDVAIPLEKERFSVQFVENAIIKNINDYIAKLPEEKILLIVMNQAKKYESVLAGKNFCAFVYGLELKSAEKALKSQFGKNLISVEETVFGKKAEEEFTLLEKNAGIILESEDKNLKCRLTLSEIFSELIDKKRAELYDALFDGEK